MPQQANTGMIGVPWAYCDTCGWQYRVSKLRMQNNLLRCPQCYDNPRQMLRDERVASKVADTFEEAENVTAKIRQEPNVVRER